jgi:cytochrome b561
MAPRVEAYRAPARLMHWLTVLFVVSTIPAGVIMVQEGLSRPLQNSLFIWHKNIGVVILVLVVARLLYRAAHPPPPLPDSLSPAQVRIAGLTHWGMYGLLLVMAVSGYVRVRAGGFPIEALDALGVPPLVPRSDALANTAKAIHFWARFPLVLLILMHVGAAAFHGIVKRDGVFSRMWPGRA